MTSWICRLYLVQLYDYLQRYPREQADQPRPVPVQYKIGIHNNGGWKADSFGQIKSSKTSLFLMGTS